MVIQPKIRGFICTTAHPIGCYKMVSDQINTVLSQPRIKGCARVLVIGSSTGYGLASRIVASFALNAKTIGICYEREADEKRTASPGWYNTAAFESLALEHGHYAKTINGDAFSDDIKQEAARLIKKDFGTIDLIIYSLASPRRVNPVNGQVSHSVLKPIQHPFVGKTIDVFREEVKEITILPATPKEITETIEVMGGEDWQQWIEYLASENLLAEGFKTVAYSYLGPDVTHAIYKEGTIGQAKHHLKQTADALSQQLRSLNGEAFVAVLKAVVTQASAAIPVVPLYMAILFKVMKEKKCHEGCIEQIYRLFHDYLYGSHANERDNEGYVRIDDKEMSHDIQSEVMSLWSQVNSDNLSELTDVKGYRDDFYQLFGFNVKDVDYEQEVNPNSPIPSLNK